MIRHSPGRIPLDMCNQKTHKDKPPLQKATLVIQKSFLPLRERGGILQPNHFSVNPPVLSMKFSLRLFFIVCTLASCGPSAEEKAAIERRKNDSIARAVEEETIHRMETKRRLEDSLAQMHDHIAFLKIELSDTKADLAVEQDRMSRIKEWQFLRSPQERDEQIRTQSLIIDDLHRSIESLEEDIGKFEKGIGKLEREVKKWE